MKQNGIYRGQWAGCSDLTERRKELTKAHEEFQKMLDNGFQLKEVKHKRSRIKKQVEPGFKIVMVFGKPMKLTIEEYNTHWNFRIDK